MSDQRAVSLRVQRAAAPPVGIAHVGIDVLVRRSRACEDRRYRLRGDRRMHNGSPTRNSPRSPPGLARSRRRREVAAARSALTQRLGTAAATALAECVASQAVALGIAHAALEDTRARAARRVAGAVDEQEATGHAAAAACTAGGGAVAARSPAARALTSSSLTLSLSFSSLSSSPALGDDGRSCAGAAAPPLVSAVAAAHTVHATTPPTPAARPAAAARESLSRALSDSTPELSSSSEEVEERGQDDDGDFDL